MWPIHNKENSVSVYAAWGGTVIVALATPTPRQVAGSPSSGMGHGMAMDRYSVGKPVIMNTWPYLPISRQFSCV